MNQKKAHTIVAEGQPFAGMSSEKEREKKIWAHTENSC